ncbi:MAG TPA: ABC transporter permease [Candidatus Bathyarchaeia archaeon]|nr:ABC transporter permease [Candidatus Bathyarchaeia archaeon]
MSALFAYRELIRNLVIKDLKLKYRDSVLGFLWSLANPLLLILVYSFVFGHILRGGPANFAYFLMVGILPWNFFAQSLMMSTGSILDNGTLIRKVAVPMEVFPMTTVLFNLAQFLLALVIFFPMAWLFFKVPLAWSWLNFFPILVVQILFTLGLSFIISTATVFYRDVRHFIEIFLMLVFWLTPIIYDAQLAPALLQRVLYMNPFSYFILAYQDALYRNVFSSLEQWVVIMLLAAVFLAAGYTLFTTCKSRFAEEA